MSLPHVINLFYMQEGSLVEWTGVMPRNPVGPVMFKKGEVYVVIRIVSPEELRKMYPTYRFSEAYIEVDMFPDTYTAGYLFNELQPPMTVDVKELMEEPAMA